MAKDLSNTEWHGIPRKQIPWFPTIDNETCIGCELCYVTCGREVYEFDVENRHGVVARPFNCLVGCSTCATVCPSQAISFPGRELIVKVEREHKVFKVVRQSAKAKREKADIARSRSLAEEEIARIVSKMHYQVAGDFGEKRFLARLRELVENRPFDIVNVKLDAPSVKSTKAPALMQFDVTSTEQGDITDFLKELRLLIDEVGFVIIAENKS